MSTMTFTELVRKIHPDMNPDITDPGAKMTAAKQHRNNPSMLFRLAVRWGLVKGYSDASQERNERSESTGYGWRNWNRERAWSAEQDGTVYIHEGCLVRWRMKKKYGIGVVTKIDRVQKGPRKGWYKVYIADLDGFRILTCKKSTLRTSLTIEFITSEPNADQKDLASKLIRKHDEQKEAYKAYRDRAKERRAEETKEDLETNVNYRGRNIWVYVRTRGRWFQVTRTTSKSVFFWDSWNNKESRCQFSSVLSVQDRG